LFVLVSFLLISFCLRVLNLADHTQLLSPRWTLLSYRIV